MTDFDYDTVIPDAYEHYHCVHEPRVAIRVGPQHDAPVVGAVPFGADVKAVRKAGDWIQLEDDPETEDYTQRWVLTDGAYHKLGTLMMPSAQYYRQNFGKFEEMKKMYQLAKDEDRLEDAIVMKKLIQEAETSEEFREYQNHSRMFTEEKGAAVISPLDALNSATAAFMAAELKKKGKRKPSREEAECGLDWMSLTEHFLNNVFVKHSNGVHDSFQYMFDEEVEMITASGAVITGRESLTAYWEETISDFKQNVTKLKVHPANEPHHRVQMATCLLSYERNGVQVTEEHRLKFGACPEWLVEKWQFWELGPDEVQANLQKDFIRELTEDDMDFMGIAEEKRKWLRLSFAEYVEWVLAPYQQKASIEANWDQPAEIGAGDTEARGEALEVETAKRHEVVEWLHGIGLGDLAPKFGSSDYSDLGVLKEMGLDEEDLDFLEIKDPNHRRILREATAPEVSVPEASKPVGVTIQAWLKELGLEHHTTVFEARGYDSVSMIMEMGLEDTDLEYLSVMDHEERRILKEAAPIR